MNLQERQSRKLLRKNSGSKRKVSNFYRAGTIPSAGDRIVPLMGFLGTSCLGMTGLLPLTSLWVTALYKLQEHFSAKIEDFLLAKSHKDKI
jgi:hypothetical protein